MSVLIFAHVVTGLAGIVSGVIVVTGILRRRNMDWCNAIFLLMTAGVCATGFAFLPSIGMTSAQLVAFFLAFLLLIAAYARYGQKLEGIWNPIYALTTVGALFLNILITIAQSFLHIPALKSLAPTQHSPVYLTVKFTLLAMFIVIALVASKRAGKN